MARTSRALVARLRAMVATRCVTWAHASRVARPQSRDSLLVRHTYGRRDWDLPGGSVKRHELPLNAARREMHEELGRDIADWDALGELSASADHPRDNLHLFRASLPDRTLDIDLTELAEAVWFPQDALPHDVGRYVRPI